MKDIIVLDGIEYIKKELSDDKVVSEDMLLASLEKEQIEIFDVVGVLQKHLMQKLSGGIYIYPEDIINNTDNNAGEMVLLAMLNHITR